jgi:hypothetical protein
MGDGLIHLLHRKAQTAEQLLGARAHGVGASFVEHAVQFAQARALLGGEFALVGFEFGEIGFELAQMGVAVDRVFQRGTFQRGRFLRDVGDAPLRRIVEFAAVGVQFTPQQGKQSRLAGAVGADQADFFAWIEGQAGGLE